MKNPKNLKPWKKGESGNPAGRPKGVRNRATILRELLTITMKDKNGQFIQNEFTGAEKVTYEEAVNISLIKGALGGKIEHIREIQDTLYGRIKEVHELTPPDITLADIEAMSDEEAERIYNFIIKS